MASNTSHNDAAATNRHTALVDLLRRFLRGRGPLTLAQIQQRYRLPEAELQKALHELVERGEAVYGRLTAGAVEPQWCDRRNLESLYRRAVVRRRQQQSAATMTDYLRFLLLYHHIDPRSRLPVSAGLTDLLERFRSMWLPLGFFEREILTTRLGVANGIEETLRQAADRLEEWSRSGQIVWEASQNGPGSRSVRFFRRGEGDLFSDPKGQAHRIADLSGAGRAVFDFLAGAGASFSSDIQSGTGLTAIQLQRALAELVWAGLVTNDQWGTVDRLSAFRLQPGMESDSEIPGVAEDRPRWSRGAGSLARRRREWKRQKRSAVVAMGGRWSLVDSPPVRAAQRPAAERARAQACVLLQRYGILAKEHYRREKGWLPWIQLFRELKRLEWRGEIRRGYFVERLSGVQFATPEAAELLQRVMSGEENVSRETVLISAMDPAVPFGPGVRFSLKSAEGKAISFTRLPSNHLVLASGEPILYLEGYGQRLWPVGPLSESQLEKGLRTLQRFLRLPAVLRPRPRIEVESWQGLPIETSPAAPILTSLGFEKEGAKFVLWPSRLT